MTKRDLKAHAWDLHDLGTIGPGNPQWDQVVAEMEKDGYRPIWGDASATHYHNVAVAVFERKPPTLFKAGDQLRTIIQALERCRQHSSLCGAREDIRAINQERICKALMDWTNAVAAAAREEARGE